MSVRLKFRVARKYETMGSTYKDGKSIPARMGGVEMYPVTGGSEENASFYASTPTGKIEFGSINSAALDYLALEAECLITIEVVPKNDKPSS